MGQTNYKYDPTGNLIYDGKEKTSGIIWDHYGKIDLVERTSGSAKPRLWFDYDAMGNRVKKTTWNEGETDPEEKATQFYLRDPQGNVIAIYALARVDGNDVVTLTEQHIYGSARLGLQTRDLVVYNAPTGSGVGGGNRTGVLDSTGKKGIVITETFPKSIFGDTENGRMIILENVSNRRISLDGLVLSSGMQSFAVPLGYALDSAERLVIAFGEDSLQEVPIPIGMVSWLGWPADSTLQWIWQDGYVLSDSGSVSLIEWDGEVATALDVVKYDANGLRRTFAGREAEVAASDFEAGAWSLGGPAVERKSIKFGFGEGYSWTQMRGGKSYELSDHLGNVAVVVGDRRMAFDPNTDLDVDYFEAEVLSARDFYPFGMVMSDRTFQTEKYRYGFQSQESDSEWLGEGNAVAFKYRVHDARLGRFLSVDPLSPEYPWNSGYAFSENKPIDHYELEGLEGIKFYLNTVKGGDLQPRFNRINEELKSESVLHRTIFGFWENNRILDIMVTVEPSTDPSFAYDPMLANYQRTYELGDKEWGHKIKFNTLNWAFKDDYNFKIAIAEEFFHSAQSIFYGGKVEFLEKQGKSYYSIGIDANLLLLEVEARVYRSFIGADQAPYEKNFTNDPAVKTYFSNLKKGIIPSASEEVGFRGAVKNLALETAKVYTKIPQKEVDEFLQRNGATPYFDFIMKHTNERLEKK
jgi:RHS repeat-associated protein